MDEADRAPHEDPRVTRTRAKVLDAARQLLLEVGFLDVTISAICARSGVSPSTVYRHWTTREEILRDAFSDAALVGYSPGRSLRDDLRDYALAFADGLQNSWGRVAATLVTTAVDDPEQRRVLRTFVDGYTADVATLLQRAADRGEQVAGRAAAEVVDSLVGPLFYRHLLRVLPLDEDFVRAQADRVHRELTDPD
ncbi:TetR family transcriptional regulator [Modestobacter sp. I12A-02628]|uniref:TetR/AcrR family transcriptional regulator n=1 Tax=Goekera deserti TaxID=2497753 RepID=A0A7K3WA09_9ACTN|nr:TetR/AcrR family transcriptional regulator [Goekera deserti]MPQ98870.1 TetR family transcriptional regulator [Goekera deserti]NDI49631.1 TetR family transcriptional regulator [Goekera deserti]NEL53176.1 TetR/AcrR family transcriptional regulator [Goekera deserti]